MSTPIVLPILDSPAISTEKLEDSDPSFHHEYAFSSTDDDESFADLCGSKLDYEVRRSESTSTTTSKEKTLSDSSEAARRASPGRRTPPQREQRGRNAMNDAFAEAIHRRLTTGTVTRSPRRAHRNGKRPSDPSHNKHHNSPEKNSNSNPPLRRARTLDSGKRETNSKINDHAKNNSDHGSTPRKTRSLDRSSRSLDRSSRSLDWSPQKESKSDRARTPPARRLTKTESLRLKHNQIKQGLPSQEISKEKKAQRTTRPHQKHHGRTTSPSCSPRKGHDSHHHSSDRHHHHTNTRRARATSPAPLASTDILLAEQNAKIVALTKLVALQGECLENMQIDLEDLQTKLVSLQEEVVQFRGCHSDTCFMKASQSAANNEVEQGSGITRRMKDYAKLQFNWSTNQSNHTSSKKRDQDDDNSSILSVDFF